MWVFYRLVRPPKKTPRTVDELLAGRVTLAISNLTCPQNQSQNGKNSLTSHDIRRLQGVRIFACYNK